MSTPRAEPPKTTAMEPMSRAWSRSRITAELWSVKSVCRDRTRLSFSGTAAQMSGTPFSPSDTYVARRPSPTLASRSLGMSGSSSVTPKAPDFSGRPDSYMRWATWMRSSARSRELSSIETRAALCTTRLSATATKAPTSAIAALSCHRRPVRMPEAGPAPDRRSATPDDSGPRPSRIPLMFMSPRPAQALSL